MVATSIYMDPETVDTLSRIRGYWKERFGKVSNSRIVSNALRFYEKHLKLENGD